MLCSPKKVSLKTHYIMLFIISLSNLNISRILKIFLDPISDMVMFEFLGSEFWIE